MLTSTCRGYKLFYSGIGPQRPCTSALPSTIVYSPGVTATAARALPIFTQVTFARSFVLSSTKESKVLEIGSTIGAIFLVMMALAIWFIARRRAKTVPCVFQLEKNDIPQGTTTSSPLPPLPPPPPQRPPSHFVELSAQSTDEKDNDDHPSHPAYRIPGGGSPVSPEEDSAVPPSEI